MVKVSVLAALTFVVGLAGNQGQLHAEEQEPATVHAPAPATEKDSLDQSAGALRNRVSILERLREVDLENNQKKASETAVVSANKDGFITRAADTSYQLRIRYEGHFDGRTFIDTTTTTRLAHFLVRRARAIFEAKVPGPFVFRVMTEFGSAAVSIPDAYLESAFSPVIGIRLGKFKVPFSLEVLQSTGVVPYVELSLSSQLSPTRDIGAQLQGEIGNGLVSYAAGVFNGAADAQTLDADWNTSKDAAGRVFFQPFQSIDFLKGFGVGAAGTYGNHNDPRDPKKWASTLAPSTIPSFKSGGQESIFKYRDTTFSSGNQTRYSIQWHWYVGPFGIISEYIKSASEITNVKVIRTTKTISNTAWNAGVIYALTGEPNGFKGLKPFRNFDPRNGQWGALELVARVSALDIDKKAFPVFADSTKSVKSAVDYTGGVNWHLNRNVKVQLSYTNTAFKGGATKGNLPDEKVVAGRVQLVF